MFRSRAATSTLNHMACDALRNMHLLPHMDGKGRGHSGRVCLLDGGGLTMWRVGNFMFAKLNMVNMATTSAFIYY